MAAERDSARRQRIVVSALVWVFVGDVAGHVTEGMSESGFVAKGAEVAFSGGDQFDHEDRDR